MIRTRNTEGKIKNLSEDDRFVEIVDEIGTVAFVVYCDDNGRVVILEPNTPEGRRYAKLFNIKFADQVVIPKFLTETHT